MAAAVQCSRRHPGRGSGAILRRGDAQAGRQKARADHGVQLPRWGIQDGLDARVPSNEFLRVGAPARGLGARVLRRALLALVVLDPLQEHVAADLHGPRLPHHPGVRTRQATESRERSLRVGSGAVSFSVAPMLFCLSPVASA
eukprot:UN1554